VRDAVEGRNAATLLDAFEVTRDEPANLRPEDDALFRHEYRRSFGPTRMYTFRNVRLTADGVVIHKRKAVPELRFVPQERLGLRYVARSLVRRARDFDREDERYVTAFNRWSANNYFHWTCDVLPRVYLARHVVEGATFVLPRSHAVPFTEESLRAFAPKTIEYFDVDEVARFRELTVPGHIAVTGNYHEPTMRELAGFLERSLADTRAAATERARLVYVTRRTAKHRYVVNEDDVVSLLEHYRFETVANEDLTFADQVRLYSRTKALVGIIGANLTNVLFMPAGSSLLQLSRAEDASNHLYYALAAAKGVHFFYQPCEYVDAGFGARWNLTVDLDELERNVEAMLRARP
jgi:capsular polysaccharide biosynthesis protein